jgi:hypothetical protein
VHASDIGQLNALFRSDSAKGYQHDVIGLWIPRIVLT